MKRNSYLQIFSIILIFMGVSAPISAQEQLNESLVVEGDFDAKIQHQNRVGVSPARLEVVLPKPSLPFASAGVPTEEQPGFFALPVTGWKVTRSYSDYKGYVDLGIGSYLNIVGSAGYRFVDTEKFVLGAMLQHNSSSLFSPVSYVWPEENENLPDKATRKRSDTRLAVYGSHDFGIGKLAAEIGYHYGNFNYYGVNQNMVSNYGKIPTQHLNDLRLNIGWSAEMERYELSYNVAVNYNYFGYANGYEYDMKTISDVKTQKENRLTLSGCVDKRIKGGSSVGINAVADMMLYSDNEELFQADDYANIRLAPYYRFSTNGINLLAGANIDITTTTKTLTLFKDSEPDFKGVHLSPNLRFEWVKNRFGLYAHALGGVELNTLASNYHLDYYQSSLLSSTKPVYSPIDGCVGVRLRPFKGFAADLSVAYKITNNVPLGGLFFYDLSSLMQSFNGNIDIKGFSFAADLKYEISDRGSVEFRGSYQPQNKGKGYFNGYDRPRWVLDTKATARVWNSLKLSVGYQYRGVRNIYAMQSENTGNGYNAIRLDDVYLLNLGVSYTLLGDRLTLWGQANNLLGSTAGLSPLFENEGFNFMLGIGLNF